MGHMICRNLAKLTFKRESGFVAKGAINCHNEPLNLDIMPKSIDKNASFDIYAHEFNRGMQINLVELLQLKIDGHG